MSQPEQVVLGPGERVRPSLALSVPRPWRPGRPGEGPRPQAPSGPRLGAAGPDLGYGLKLARLFEERLRLHQGEHRHDVVAGCFACASRRSAHFGRAPVIWDLEWAFGLWGYLDEAPEDLVDFRRRRFSGAAEDYWRQREIADAVRPETLALTPGAVRARIANWKELLIA